MFEVTNTGRAQRLLDYKNRVEGNQWILISRTSAWTNESLPPLASNLLTELIEPIKFFRVTNYRPAYKTNNGDVITSAGTYQTVSNYNLTNLAELKANYLIIDSVVNTSDLANLTYRTIGLCNNLSNNPFNLNTQNYTNNITYVLEGVINTIPQTNSGSLNVTYRFVLEF